MKAEIFKTVQWNIGGGKVFQEGAGPTLRESYVDDGLDYIIDFLRAQKPDLISLQETHANDIYCQPQRIAEALGYQSWVNDEWADSHLEDGMRLGQAVVSRYPIQAHSFEWFANPQLLVTWSEGMSGITHDKGVTRCSITLENGKDILVQTLHTIPFRHTGLGEMSEQLQRVREEMARKLLTKENGIIQADFNINALSLRPFFPRLFADGFEEVVQTKPTNVRGRYYDHVLYSGLRVISSVVIDNVLTDHYPVITTFEIVDNLISAQHK